MNNNVSEYETNITTTNKSNNQEEKETKEEREKRETKEANKAIGKVLSIIGGIAIVAIILFLAVLWIVSSNSNKLVCKSSSGNITIMYNNSTITGYKSFGMSYDIDQQRHVANQMGIDNYISQFKTWFETNTTGSCTIEKNN